MDKHLNEFNNIMTQLQSVGIDFDDETNALLILSSLPESWDGTVTTVSSSARGEKLRYYEVWDMALVENMHRKRERVPTNAVLVTENRGKGGGSNGGSQGRGKLIYFHCGGEKQIGRASCRERVCQYV